MSAPTTSPAHRPPAAGLVGLTFQLTAARFGARQGESLLYFAGVLAYTIASGLALTVASGTLLFWRRSEHPTGTLAELVAHDSTFSLILSLYVALAVTACALLVPATVNLASGAALLGARGRERRLASLRLMGLTSGDVTRMALLDALLQFLIGAALGGVGHVLSLPLWDRLTMQSLPLTTAEMMLPAWLTAAVIVGVGLVGMFATWRGLRQVVISPLGVARRANKPGLSWLRAVVFVVLLGVVMVIVNVVRPGSQLVPYLVLGGGLVIAVVAINLVAPWLLQLIARAVAHVPSPAMMWAARRIVADAAATWRRVSGMALLAFIGGYMALMPILIDPDDDSAVVRGFVQATRLDFVKGVVITLAVGFVLTATSMLIGQASGTIERSEQSRALHRMGAPTSFGRRVMWLEVFGPLVVGVALSTALGAFMALPMYRAAQRFQLDDAPGLPMIAAVLVVGLTLAAASLLATRPLHVRLLRLEERRND